MDPREGHRSAIGMEGREEPSRPGPAGEAAARPATARRIATWAALVLAMLLALTLTLTLVYSVVTPPSTLMLARWLTGRPVMREAVPLDAVSPALIRAVFASEDQRFCLHHGIDWGALQDVVEDENGPSRGASTITMQTVKNVFLWSGRSYVRKAIELPLALFVDLIWGKRRTMEIYLNVAEWGEGVFGAEAAARHWFGKGARDLKPNEAVLLAAILPNPLERDARKPSPATLAKAGRIRGAMRDVGGYMDCLPTR